MLPEGFKERMKKMLGGEYEEFLSALEKEAYHALRINPLKTDIGEGVSGLPFTLSPVPWAEGGFYYGKEAQPGKHPFHDAGVYYIQEPSAMAPAMLMDAQPGERVLDLCAAPGGKSTQIAACMEGKGLLVCNEIHPARARILSENVERMGVTNAVVTNETPDRLAERFPGFFHRILVDAPCSGEGMFRKNEAACGEWSPQNAALCAARQDAILEAAYLMLHPGGTLCYSTCTFAPVENEGSISRFLRAHADMRVKEVPCPEGFCPGRPDWIRDPAEGLEHTFRLWPHRLAGEGHYVALLTKGEGSGQTGEALRRRGGVGSSPQSASFEEFAGRYLYRVPEGTILRFGEQLYLPPAGLPSLAGLKVLRPGLHLGTEKKNRFEPAHALALSMKPSDARHVYAMASDGPEISAWLNGGSLRVEGEKGWYLMCAEGFGIGWGKLAGGMMKNHYPKGLRRG